jgi:NhaP-type Na+/H+ or K+/H+ antiporter
MQEQLNWPLLDQVLNHRLLLLLLQQVGADEKLASVIDGESLVNDGSALVIFLVLQQFVQGASLSLGQVNMGVAA